MQVVLFYYSFPWLIFCQELVTFGSHPLSKPPEIVNAGKHLSAVEFHSALLNSGERSLCCLSVALIN